MDWMHPNKTGPVVNWVGAAQIIPRFGLGLINLLRPAAADNEVDTARRDYGDVYTDYRVPAIQSGFDPTMNPRRIFQYVPGRAWATVVSHQGDGLTLFGAVVLEGAIDPISRAVTYRSVQQYGRPALSNSGAMLFSDHVSTNVQIDQDVVDAFNTWKLPPSYQPFFRAAHKRFMLTVSQTDDADVFRIHLDIEGYRTLNYPATLIGDVLLSPLTVDDAPIASDQLSGHQCSSWFRCTPETTTCSICPDL